MTVSIIVPVYKAEKYLERCIESLLNQTYTNIEVILVNDGSPDRCPLICDNYKLKDNRIRVIHSENNGQSIARNRGIDISTGEYICFVDADDVLVNNAIESLILLVNKNNYDIVCGNYYIVKDQKNKLPKASYSFGEINKYGTKEEKKRYDLFKTSSLFGYVWGKLYKSSFIHENKLRFQESKDIFMEDALFNLKAFSYQPKYLLTNDIVYYYYIYNSSTSNKSEDVTTKAIKMIDNYYKFLKNKDLYEENLDLYIPLVARVICWSIYKKIVSDGLKYKYIYNTIKEFSRYESIEIAFGDKKSHKELRQLPNMLESIYYSILSMCFKRKFYSLLSFGFYCTYPIAWVYIKKSVKN